MIYIACSTHDRYYVLIPGDLKAYLVGNQKCIYSCIIAFSIEVNGSENIVKFWFNNEAYHSSPLSLAVLDNVIFMSLSALMLPLQISTNLSLHVRFGGPEYSYVYFFSLNLKFKL